MNPRKIVSIDRELIKGAVLQVLDESESSLRPSDISRMLLCLLFPARREWRRYACTHYADAIDFACLSRLKGIEEWRLAVSD